MNIKVRYMGRLMVLLSTIDKWRLSMVDRDIMKEYFYNNILLMQRTSEKLLPFRLTTRGQAKSRRDYYSNEGAHDTIRPI